MKPEYGLQITFIKVTNLIPVPVVGLDIVILADIGIIGVIMVVSRAQDLIMDILILRV